MLREDFFMLTHDVAPCWYEIGFDKKTPAIIVKIHKEFLRLAFNDKGYEALWRVEPLMKQFGFIQFDENLRGDFFGFDRAFRRLGEEESFSKFSAEIPVLEKFRMKTCNYCQGHKKDLLLGGECPICHGSGEEKKMKICHSCNGDKKDVFGDDCRWCYGKGGEADSYLDWQSLNAISATFMVFFEMMQLGEYRDKAISNHFAQLISVNAYIDKEMNSAPLDGVYCIPLIEWFQNNPECEVAEAKKAMKIVWAKIQGGVDDIDELNTWAKIGRNGLFHINCPGDRTGLIPDINFGLHRGKEGYKFYCHNLDTSAQQITLLAGLGALCDKVRREIEP